MTSDTTAANTHKNKQTALITGASSGIGAALARQLAAHGWNLALVARNQERLDLIAKDLHRQHAVSVEILAQDLAQPAAAQMVHAWTRQHGITVDLLVNNAGAGHSGPVIAAADHAYERLIDLNITSMTELSRLFAGDMAGRGRGQILNVASTGAYQPGPYTAVYYAAKSYVHSFSLAMDEELRGTGVSVSLLCPGATATEFSSRAGKADLTSAMPAAQVARAAVQGLLRRQRLIIPGFGNRLVIVLSKILPGHWLAWMVARIQKPLLLG